jgi:hypothetical protein
LEMFWLLWDVSGYHMATNELTTLGILRSARRWTRDAF